MIKKLRQRFIITAMLSVASVLGLIILIMNIYNYVQMEQRANSLLSLLSENSGDFPKDYSQYFSPADNDSQQPPQKPDEIVVESTSIEAGTADAPGNTEPKDFMTAETPFETRFFSVTLDSDGEIISTDVTNIAAISEETAEEYAQDLLAAGKSSGYLDSYKYLEIVSDDQVQYIFLDCGKELTTFYSYLRNSLLIGAIGLFLVFLMVLLLSRRTLRPVEESYYKQKRFITDASHELKTPLTIIDANADILEMENGEGEWTDSIKNQVKRLTALVEKMVFLTRMDEGSTSMEMKAFSLSEAVRDTAESFTAIASSRGRDLQLQIEDGISMNGNEENIRRLVSLLLDNAMKYSSEASQIRLTLKTEGKNKLMTLWNAVDSIDKGNLNVLFERFYRTDSSRNSRSGGFGIGLSVAQAIVEAHKGKISAKSEDGHSILFTIEL